ncbi:MAG: HAD-IIB family hydrolase [Gammaproteobacteria bacterium]|jgi:mannosyl-3-phosphoglycerate phosphatase family protein
MSRIVIYTDLDGSLLDHETYSHAEADPLLAELEQQGVPVIPVSSKTRAELLEIRRELGNRHPFIAENGAAVFIPAGYFDEQPAGTQLRDGFLVREFSLRRSYWLGKLDAVAAQFHDDYSGFESLSRDEIVGLTGLAPEDAGRAAQREYGEPLRWQGDETRKAAFIRLMEQHGATILQGGRFMHVSGDCDKGRALLWLNAQYAKALGEMPVSIAIGDSHNDAAMLEAADHAIIIRSPSHAPPGLSRGDGVLVTHGTGPVGWDEGVRKILETITTDNNHG